MKTIAYCSPFVPPEWISAHGLQPCWMSIRCANGGPSVGTSRSVCPFAGAVVDQANRGIQASGIVLTTSCDQMRYAAALIESRSDLPVFLLNVPSTWQTDAARRLYRDELDRLGRFLVRLGGVSPSASDLAKAMADYDDRRRCLQDVRGQFTAGEYARAILELRGDGQQCRPYISDRAICSDYGTIFRRCGSSALAAALPPYELRTRNAKTDLVQRGVPVAILGGPLPEHDHKLFDVIEQAGGRVVLDATESGERTLPAPFDSQRVNDDPLRELARAYFDAIPAVFRRPNDALYHWLGQRMSERQVRGILLRRYVWCDLWHAELARLKQWSPVPVLEIDVCDQSDSLSRVAGRIEAFFEVLA